MSYNRKDLIIYRLGMNMNKQLLEILVCPVSKTRLVKRGNELWNHTSGLAYSIDNGIPVMLESEAGQLSKDELDSIKN